MMVKLYDHRGQLIPPKDPWYKRILKILKLWGKKGPTAIAIAVAVTVLLLNFEKLSNLWEKGPTSEITVQISNQKNVPAEINPLLDYHVVMNQFHPGILLSGQSPTGRLRMIPLINTDSGYHIDVGDTIKYIAKIDLQPYKGILSRGGGTIVFVIHIENLDKMAYIETPFEDQLIGKLTLIFKIN